MEKADRKITVYELDDGFYLDIADGKDGYEAWLYHEDYGIKSMMFSIPFSKAGKKRFKEIVEQNIDEYISSYEEDYMN